MNVSLLAVWLLLLPAAPRTVAECREVLDRHEKQPYEQHLRSEAIRVLGALGTPDSTRVLESVLDDEWEHLQDEAVSALGALRRKDALVRRASVEMLGEFLGRRREPRTQRHLATALGLIGDRAAVVPLLAILRRSRDAEVIGAVAEALARLDDAQALGPLTDKARLSAPGRAACVRAMGAFAGGAEAALAWAGGDDDVRAAVVDALVARGRDVLPDLELDSGVGERFGIALAEALPAVRDAAARRRRAAFLLGHESWRVRAAAIGALVGLRDAALVGDLVDRLERERGRLRHDAWIVLRRLTGRDLPDDAAQWRAVLPIAELPEQTDEAAAAARGEGRSSARYFGLPVVSERIAFVFDASGSMREDGKLEHARAAFVAAVGGLGPRQQFDAFLLRYQLEYPPRPKLERAFGQLRAGRVEQATRWLDDQEARGGDALFDALVAAMDDPEVDTVYLLSDGVPSYGSVARDVRVLQEIARHNRWRRVVIHTILLGDRGSDRAFMRDLAEAAGGVAVDGEGRPLTDRAGRRER